MSDKYEDEISGFRLVQDGKIDVGGKKENSYWDNHHTLDYELELLKTWVECLKDIFDNDVEGCDAEELAECEKKLNISLPPDVKLIYQNFGKDEKFLKDRHSKRYFIPLEKLYVLDNNLAYQKQGRKYIWGADLEKNRGNYYFKDQWHWNKGDMPQYEIITTSLFISRLSNMENVAYAKCKGFSVDVYIDKIAIEKFADYFSPLSGFSWYGHMLFYNKKNKAIAWFRGSCSVIDILIGCDDLSFIERFMNDFKFNPMYRVKNGEIPNKKDKKSTE